MDYFACTMGMAQLSLVVSSDFFPFERPLCKQSVPIFIFSRKSGLSVVAISTREVRPCAPSHNALADRRSTKREKREEVESVHTNHCSSSRRPPTTHQARRREGAHESAYCSCAPESPLSTGTQARHGLGAGWQQQQHLQQHQHQQQSAGQSRVLSSSSLSVLPRCAFSRP